MATTTSGFYVDPVLSNLSVAYQPQMFIADRIFPRIGGLTKPSGQYYKFLKEHFGPIPETLRAPGTRAREISWTHELATFITEQRALIGQVTDEDRDAQDAPIQLEQNTVTNTTELMMMDRERRVVALLTDVSKYPAAHTEALAGTGQWSNPTVSTPVADIQSAKTQLRTVGVDANTVVIPANVYDALFLHADIIDRIKYTGTGLVTEAVLKQLFNVDNVLIPNSVYNGANAGQSATLTDLWTDFVWVGYVAPRPAMRTLSFGFTFEYRPRRVNRWREEDKHSDFFEVMEQVGEAIVSNEAGFLFTNTLA